MMMGLALMMAVATGRERLSLFARSFRAQPEHDDNDARPVPPGGLCFMRPAQKQLAKADVQFRFIPN